MSDPNPTLPVAPPNSTVEYYRPVPVYMARPRSPRYRLAILLLLATIFTTLVVGSHMQANFNSGHSAMALDFGDSVYPPFPLDTIWKNPHQLWLGIPFSASLMLILFAHEMGHYLFCLRYGVDATLPYFIPFPSLVGTMGAFIRIRSSFRSRAALFDVGIAGPIAGFVVACSVLFFSLGLSRSSPTLPVVDDQLVGIHLPLIFELAQWLRHLVGLGSAARLDPNHLHPVAIAAWFGMLATSLNLLPGGQLDGGHIVYAIAPRAHRIVSRLTILFLIPMAVYFWAGWLIWAVLLELSSLRHPHVPEQPKITGGRRWLAAFAVVMLVLSFTPTPIEGISLKEVSQPAREWVKHLLHR
jgi:Zn-dependent protease